MTLNSLAEPDREGAGREREARELDPDGTVQGTASPGAHQPALQQRRGPDVGLELPHRPPHRQRAGPQVSRREGRVSRGRRVGWQIWGEVSSVRLLVGRNPVREECRLWGRVNGVAPGHAKSSFPGGLGASRKKFVSC